MSEGSNQRRMAERARSEQDRGLRLLALGWHLQSTGQLYVSMSVPVHKTPPPRPGNSKWALLFLSLKVGREL